MDQYYMFIVSILFCMFGYLSAIPPGEKPPNTQNYASHKNFNLLAEKNECGNNIAGLEDKVFGGTTAGLEEFPWMARLKYQNGSNTVIKCAGVLINHRYVLTAAHCIIGQGDVVQVRLGENDERTDPDFEMLDGHTKTFADPVVDVDVEEIIPHQKYHTIIKHNDIALIRMKQNVNYTKFIAPICLPLNGEQADIGHALTLAGWGKTQTSNFSPIKLKALIPVVSQQQCATLFAGAKRPIIQSQLCAGGREGVDACNGDSGGPLINCFNDDDANFYLEGIVSFGLKECGKKHVPGVYTRVSVFVDWVLDNMKPF